MAEVRDIWQYLISKVINLRFPYITGNVLTMKKLSHFHKRLCSVNSFAYKYVSFCCLLLCLLKLMACKRDGGGTVFKVLCYKSEGCWFDSSWCHWNYSLT